MQGNLTLAVSALMLTVASQATAWDARCQYGEFDQDNMFCEVSNGFGQDRAFNVWYRSGDDRYGFSYRAPKFIELAENGLVEIRLDDGDVKELGTITYTNSDRVSSTRGANSYFQLEVPSSEAEAVLADMERADVIRLRAETKEVEKYLYAEVPLGGFGAAIQALEENTK